MALKRMDNVGIVVDDLTATIDFFRELGLELEGEDGFVIVSECLAKPVVENLCSDLEMIAIALYR